MVLTHAALDMLAEHGKQPTNTPGRHRNAVPEYVVMPAPEIRHHQNSGASKLAILKKQAREYIDRFVRTWRDRTVELNHERSTASKVRGTPGRLNNLNGAQELQRDADQLRPDLADAFRDATAKDGDQRMVVTTIARDMEPGKGRILNRPALREHG